LKRNLLQPKLNLNYYCFKERALEKLTPLEVKFESSENNDQNLLGSLRLLNEKKVETKAPEKKNEQKNNEKSNELFKKTSKQVSQVDADKLCPETTEIYNLTTNANSSLSASKSLVPTAISFNHLPALVNLSDSPTDFKKTSPDMQTTTTVSLDNDVPPTSVIQKQTFINSSQTTSSNNLPTLVGVQNVSNEIKNNSQASTPPPARIIRSARNWNNIKLDNIKNPKTS
jgi:hypothetical protein